MSVTTANPFDHKSVEKALLATYMPTAENKRRCRTYLRKQARHIEAAFGIGCKDGQSGKPIIPLEDLPKSDSFIGRRITQFAYTAYQSGYRVGAAERKEG